MAPIRVLQIMPAMDAGGMETFIMNVYRTIDRDRVQFDFLYHYDKPCFFDYEIQALGGKITKLTVRQDNNLPRYLRELDSFFSEHPEYRIIHGHYSGFGMFYNKKARQHGVPVRIGHSHNTAYEPNFVGQLDRWMSRGFAKDLTDCFACSRQAGEMLFPGREFTVLPNGVDTDLFSGVNPERRQKLREHLGVGENDLLLGHVGRFSAQKNHTGLLNIFSSVLQIRPDAHLLMLGGGALMERIQAQAKAMGVFDRCIFAGVRTDIATFYDAMDAFLLPSLFEGLPVVLVEAQVSGLPCFVSDTIDRGAAFAANVRFLPLNAPDVWANAITTAPLPRNQSAVRQARAAGFDIRSSAARLQEFYLQRWAETAGAAGAQR